MDFLVWNTTPVYKGNQPQPVQSTGLLAGLGRLLGGGGAPTYKTLNSASVQTPTRSSGFWSAFSAAPPVYKTATAGGADDSSPDDSSPDDGDGDSDPTCVCDDQATVVVIE